MRLFAAFAALLLAAFTGNAQQGQSNGWPEYGGDLSGQRYSTEQQIDPGNVAALKPVWAFHTHALKTPSPFNKAAAFEATPVLWNNTLYFDTPFNAVYALDASTGRLKWRYDPHVQRKTLYIVTSRGVALWHASAPKPGLCGTDSVLVATLDRRLIALDAKTGQPCPRFGVAGTVDLSKGVAVVRADLYFFTSPPVAVGDTIVVGSSVGDNQQLFVASGAVRGFDARTGQQRWSWEPLRWTGNQAVKQSGSGNAWAPLAADPEHDLVFAPTGSPSLDYYGGTRLGDNRDADSVVALRASTGAKVWAFQLVHHDIWDYDTASQPLLFTFRGNTPALAITNKTGMIYVLNRLTGQPLYPVEERPVPASGLRGETTWPTQPFSKLPPLLPLQYTAADLRGSDKDREFCRQQMSEVDYKGLFTPPSERGTLIYPAALGGPNWGSSAFDPVSGVMYTRVSSLPFRLILIPKIPTLMERAKRKWARTVPAWMPGSEVPDALASSDYRPPDMGLGPADSSTMRGAPFSMQLQALVSPDGIPCGPAPFGRIVATNLQTGRQLWSVPHGNMVPGLPGSVGTGGTMVTAGGLVFAASTDDPFLRAYDAHTGAELWKGGLPATANATPMTYAIRGRQYVVIAVGGHRRRQGDESDEVVAFALPPARATSPRK